MIELNYDCVIEEPDFLSQKKGDCLYSPIFSAKANAKIRWRLIIYPKGNEETSNDCLGLFLERVLEKNNPPVVVKFKILSLLKNGKNIAFSPREFQHEMGNSPLNCTWGWSDFVKLDLVQRDNQRVDPDELKICCQLVYTI